MVTSSVPGLTCAGGLGVFPKIIAWAGLGAAGAAVVSVRTASVVGARRGLAGTAAEVAGGRAAGGGAVGGVAAGGATVGITAGATGFGGVAFVLTVANSAGGSIEYKEAVFDGGGVWDWFKSISIFTSAARAAACAGLSSARTERQLAIQTTHKPR